MAELDSASVPVSSVKPVRLRFGNTTSRIFPQGWRTVLLLPLQGASIFVLLAGWEILARSGLFSPFLLPPFSAVLERIYHDMASGILVSDFFDTLYRAMFGFLISTVLGITIGVLIARVRFFNWLFDPIVSVGFPTPKVAFLPIFMLWFGVFDASKIALIIFNAVFPIIIATVAGTQAVEKELVWSARSLGARKRDLLWEIVLPGAMPQILTGLQVALPIALVIAVVAELLMGGTGIGGTMIRAARFADSLGVFAGIVEVAVIGWVLIKGMELLRSYLLAWHPETQSVSTV